MICWARRCLEADTSDILRRTSWVCLWSVCWVCLMHEIGIWLEVWVKAWSCSVIPVVLKALAYSY